MEEAPAADLYAEALHPYTKLLFSSVAGNTVEGGKSRYLRYRPPWGAHGCAPPPSAGGPSSAEEGPPQRPILSGEVRTALSETSLCAFAERCPLAGDPCRAGKPPMREIAPGRKVRCFRV
jgi:ABC-type dipeptide/oligopeptide/nickel transport system ATPase component